MKRFILALSLAVPLFSFAAPVVVLEPPTCNTASGNTTWAWIDYIGLVVNSGTTNDVPSGDHEVVIIHRCFTAQNLCQASLANRVSQSFTITLGASSNAQMYVGNFGVPNTCYQESN